MNEIKNVDIFYNKELKETLIRLNKPIECFGETIPIGFISDGASIPQIFNCRLAKIDGRYLKVFLKHDYLYDTKKYERLKCDEMLRDDLKSCGMNIFLRNQIYYVVRAFGSKHF